MDAVENRDLIDHLAAMAPPMVKTILRLRPANCRWLGRQDAVHEPGSTGSQQE